MAIVTIGYTLLVILYVTSLQTSDAQSANRPDSSTVFQSLNSLIKVVEDLSKIVEKLETKIETQGAMMNTLDTKIETLGTLMNTLDATVGMQATLLHNRMTNASLQATQLHQMLELQATKLSNLEAQAQNEATLISNLVTKEESQATSLKLLEATIELQVTSLNNLKNLSTNVQTLRTEVAKLSEDVQKTCSFNEFVEEIFATTNSGMTLLDNRMTNASLQAAQLHQMLELQATVLNNLEAQAQNQATLINNLVANEGKQATSLKQLEATGELQVSSLNYLKNLSTNVQTLRTEVAKLSEDVGHTRSSTEFVEGTVATTNSGMTLLDNRMTNASLQATQLHEMLDLQATVLNKLEAQAQTQATLINNLVTKEESQATSLNNSLVANEGIQANSVKILEATGELKVTSLNNLKNLSTNVQTLRTEVAKLSADVQKTRSTIEQLEGIVAGTDAGVVVIPRGSRELKIISSKPALGVAFDWSTRKVYWIEHEVGIRRSNLDGTSVELIIADTLDLWGLAVDQITGNIYYGIRPPKQELRVCGRSGKNCTVIASGTDLIGEKFFDIALYPSEGIMFWSNFKGNKTVIRANMDGTDAKVIVSEGPRGIGVDEASQTLYSANAGTRIVASYNLNGSNKKILLNATLSPSDVAVYGDTVYFGNWFEKNAYSLNEAGVLSLIANTTGKVRHIALYGKNKVPSRPNPCENSPCMNVCVLNWASYTCL